MKACYKMLLGNLWFRHILIANYSSVPIIYFFLLISTFISDASKHAQSIMWQNSCGKITKQVLLLKLLSNLTEMKKNKLIPQSVEI